MPKTRVDLGGRAYLFRSTPHAASCLISCHGFYRNGAGTYTPNGVILHFYCPHDQTVDDILNVNVWRVDHPNVVDRVPSADGTITTCTDYTLKKLQESHLDIEETARSMGITYAEAERAHGLGGETYTQLRQLNLPNYDVATVRRRGQRFGGEELLLSRLIALIEHHHHYANYHCLFCRERK